MDQTSNISSNIETKNSEQFSLSIRNLRGLPAVEELISSKFTSDARLLSEISSYLLNLGGKRIRPALCLMCAEALGCDPLKEELIQIAAGIELIHMATLLHDDIIDNSEIRRHKPSANKLYGISNTLLTGDFLLVRAFSLCAHLDDYIIECTERACVELTEGEILETPLTKEKHTLQSSLQIARKKTASLFRLATETAAYVSEAKDETITLMADFGENLGVAFQILDDILDVTSNEDLLGKKAGSDLIERKPSIINVLWLASGNELAQRLLLERSVLNESIDEDTHIKSSIEYLRNSSIVNDAKQLAREYAEKARHSLERALSIHYPNNSSKIHNNSVVGLKALIDYCIERIK